jgi:hypothetical protein
MKKIFKIISILALAFIAFIILIPVIFEGKIIELVKKTINNNIDATVDFKEADLILWKSFPNAEVALKNVSLVTNAPFEGDTLFSAAAIDLKMPFKDIFKSDGINITSFVIDNASVAIKINAGGKANYDIAIAKNTENTPTNDNVSESFQLKLESYEIHNSTISYEDVSGNMAFQLTDFNHSGTGNLSATTSKLTTTTSGLISFQLDSVRYLNKNKIKLDAVFRIDVKEQRYSFLDNKAIINQLPLVFDGFVKVNKKNQEVKLAFKTPSSDFKNFLALIPEVYSKNIEGVTTTGNFDVTGNIEGIVDDTHIPTFNISIASNNASFKYPNLPKSLKNININTEIVNKTGLIKDTYIAIEKLSFKVDEDIFNATATLRDITENMKVNASVKGTVNLASLEKIYPAEAVKGLKGIVNVDATTNFDMASIEKKRYQNTKTAGAFKLSNFEYVSTELNNPLQIKKAAVTFTPKTVQLNEFDAQLGQTDVATTGTIKNLLGFLFNDEDLEGKFKMTSTTFSVNDFMVAETMDDTDNGKTAKAGEQLKIPSFLDVIVNAKATTVLYDDIVLKNVTGTMLINDQKAILKNMKSSVFGGNLGFNGLVSTKDSIATFAMNLDVANFDIASSFSSLKLFQALAPIAQAVQGKINSKISLSGNLNDDFTPDLNSLSGDVLGELFAAKISPDSSPLLQGLEQHLNFLDVKKLNLENLKTSLTFKDGKVALKPFTLHYDDIEITVSGSHNFDTSLAYDAVIKIPAKYLGKETSQLIAQLNDKEQNDIKVPVNALITGKFQQPAIKTDLTSAIANLSKQIANKQKEKLVEKGKDEVTNVLNGLLGGSEKEKDSTTTDTVKKNNVKEVANDILGLFGKKKKKKKDTIN